ncbi:MAG: hypothetical protein ACOCUU_00580 [Nanoarchaeota archaeon]
MKKSKNLLVLLLCYVLNFSGFQNSFGQEKTIENIKETGGLAQEILERPLLKDENFYDKVIRDKRGSSEDKQKKSIEIISDTLTFYRKPQRQEKPKYAEQNFYKEVFGRWEEKIKKDPFWLERNGWDRKRLPYETQLYEAIYDSSVKRFQWFSRLDATWKELDEKTTLKFEKNVPKRKNAMKTRIKPRVELKGKNLQPYMRFKCKNLYYAGDIEGKLSGECFAIGRKFNINNSFLKQSLDRDFYIELDLNWENNEIKIFSVFEASYW